ncbi:MAG: hypothetical protein ACI8YQ_000647 [Polaribacter sp.]|jgi:hypothetical protein
MENEYFEVEPAKPFAESRIWQLNRDFYQEKGISAWSDDVVPHHMTSNAMVGKTYAELILAFLKDLAAKGQTKETVYILELGAGHGRLAFHILKHLQKRLLALKIEIPPYCYVLSDIVEKNLNFFQEHPQFQGYLQQGILDVAYFDAMESQEIVLRHAKTTIRPNDLKQPILAVANYFFDSLPTDLFWVHSNNIATCLVALQSKEDPKEMDAQTLLKNLELVFHKEPIQEPFYENPILNEILNDYKTLFSDSHLFFPKKGFQCLSNLKEFSKAGLMLISMDKGFHDIHDLQKKQEPEIITHGSFSLWVNYHALGAFCTKQNGKALFPTLSNFHLDIGCLLFLPDGDSYIETDAAFQNFVNDFGPDDFNSIKRLAYFNIAKLNLMELIALFRLSAYDSTFFVKLLPRLKQIAHAISFNERKRLAETLHHTWDMYFNINEPYDLGYELGGMLYDLGFYKEALVYFQYSVDSFGQKADIYYNKGLCHYQLREDRLFMETLKEAKLAFPGDKMIEKLEGLDMGAN